jgi:RNA polymerase sigma factor (sigma-70 family)
LTDNLSYQTNKRIFSAATPLVLNADYRRSAEIEKQIAECLALSDLDFKARLAINKFNSPNFVKGETLVCLLGLAHAENLFQIREIAARLTKIGENLVRKFLRAKDYGENFIEEAVGEIIAEMLIQILGRGEKSYDFWEVNFYSSLERLTNNYLRKHGAKSRLTATFSELSNAETEDEFDFESRLENDETLSVEKQLEIKEILGKMTGENRRIFIFHRVSGWTQEQIAEVLGITARTVRNRLKQIDEFLEDFRSRGEK